MNNEINVGDKFTSIITGNKYLIVFVNEDYAVATHPLSSCPTIINKCALLGQSYKRGWSIKLQHGKIYKLSNKEVCQAVKMPTWDHYKMIFKNGELNGRYNEDGTAHYSVQSNSITVLEEVESWSACKL